MLHSESNRSAIIFSDQLRHILTNDLNVSGKVGHYKMKKREYNKSYK